jgi:ABC-2 type transport system ATP-binding protein
VLQVLGEEDLQLQFNGGFYTVTSTRQTTKEIITRLVENNISMSYFRDITYSTKRYF